MQGLETRKGWRSLDPETRSHNPRVPRPRADKEIADRHRGRPQGPFSTSPGLYIPINIYIFRKFTACWEIVGENIRVFHKPLLHNMIEKWNRRMALIYILFKIYQYVLCISKINEKKIIIINQLTFYEEKFHKRNVLNGNI